MFVKLVPLSCAALLLASPVSAQSPFRHGECLRPLSVKIECQVNAAYRYEACKVVDGPDAETLGPIALREIHAVEAPRTQPNGASSVGASVRIPYTVGRRGGMHAFESISPDFSAESLYPAGARRTHVSGEAVLECDIAENRRLTGCRVISETPKGKGFAEAGLALTGTVLACDRSEGPMRMIADFRNRPGEHPIVLLIGLSGATEADD